MKATTFLFFILAVTGCAVPSDEPDIYSVERYGWHYTNTTTLGINYRVDQGGVDLNPEMLDYYYTSTINCVGIQHELKKLLIISTTEDINPDDNYPAEGRAWGAGMIAINTVRDPGMTYPLLTHELVHIIVLMNSHDHEAYERCGFKRY